MTRSSRYLTAEELGVVLGMSASGIRNVISRKQIKSVGKGHYGARLYEPKEVIRAAGARVRDAKVKP